jgi:hypothetical protein
MEILLKGVPLERNNTTISFDGTATMANMFLRLGFLIKALALYIFTLSLQFTLGAFLCDMATCSMFFWLSTATDDLLMILLPQNRNTITNNPALTSNGASISSAVGSTDPDLPATYQLLGKTVRCEFPFATGVMKDLISASYPKAFLRNLGALFTFLLGEMTSLLGRTTSLSSLLPLLD